MIGEKSIEAGCEEGLSQHNHDSTLVWIEDDYDSIVKIAHTKEKNHLGESALSSRPELLGIRAPFRNPFTGHLKNKERGYPRERVNSLEAGKFDGRDTSPVGRSEHTRSRLLWNRDENDTLDHTTRASSETSELDSVQEGYDGENDPNKGETSEISSNSDDVNPANSRPQESKMVSQELQGKTDESRQYKHSANPTEEIIPMQHDRNLPSLFDSINDYFSNANIHDDEFRFDIIDAASRADDEERPVGTCDYQDSQKEETPEDIDYRRRTDNDELQSKSNDLKDFAAKHVKESPKETLRQVPIVGAEKRRRLREIESFVAGTRTIPNQAAQKENDVKNTSRNAPFPNRHEQTEPGSFDKSPNARVRKKQVRKLSLKVDGCTEESQDDSHYCMTDPTSIEVLLQGFSKETKPKWRKPLSVAHCSSSKDDTLANHDTMKNGLHRNKLLRGLGKTKARIASLKECKAAECTTESTNSPTDSDDRSIDPTSIEVQLSKEKKLSCESSKNGRVRWFQAQSCQRKGRMSRISNRVAGKGDREIEMGNIRLQRPQSNQNESMSQLNLNDKTVWKTITKRKVRKFGIWMAPRKTTNRKKSQGQKVLHSQERAKSKNTHPKEQTQVTQQTSACDAPGALEAKAQNPLILAWNDSDILVVDTKNPVLSGMKPKKSKKLVDRSQDMRTGPMDRDQKGRTRRKPRPLFLNWGARQVASSNDTASDYVDVLHYQRKIEVLHASQKYCL